MSLYRLNYYCIFGKNILQKLYTVHSYYNYYYRNIEWNDIVKCFSLKPKNTAVSLTH